MPEIAASERESGNGPMEPAAGNTRPRMPALTPGGLPSDATAPAAPATPSAEHPRVVRSHGDGTCEILTLIASRPLDLGAVLRPLSPEDDLLAEMLEGQHQTKCIDCFKFPEENRL